MNTLLRIIADTESDSNVKVDLRAALDNPEVQASGPTDKCKAFSAVACKWKRPDLWMQVIKTCVGEGDTTVLPPEDITAAFKTFALHDIRDGYVARHCFDFLSLNWLSRLEHLLFHESDSTRKWVLITHLDMLAADMPDDAPTNKADTQRWIASQKSRILETAKKLETSEQNQLIAIANVNGGIGYLRDQ